MTPHEKYPALMAYIDSRSEGDPPAHKWCSQLRIDQEEAINGGLADVASDLARAQADYKAQKEAAGSDGFPYNRDMGVFLGLPIRSNGEPPVGYYMASCVKSHFRYGAAAREIKSLLDSGTRTLRVVAARNKTTGVPVRFHTFMPDQVVLDGSDVVCQNDRVKIRLSNNWSVETCFERVAEALKLDRHYGYDPIKDGPLPTKEPPKSAIVGGPGLF